MEKEAEKSHAADRLGVWNGIFIGKTESCGSILKKRKAGGGKQVIRAVQNNMGEHDTNIQFNNEHVSNGGRGHTIRGEQGDQYAMQVLDMFLKRVGARIMGTPK